MSSNPFAGDQNVPATSGNGAGIDLSQFDDDFESAEAPEYAELPDGKYQVTISKAQLAESNQGDPMIKWDLIIISGTHEGRHVFKNAVISQKSMPYVKADLTRLGLEMKRISELPGRLPEVLDKNLEITVRTKGEFTNVYFNKVLSIPAGGPAPDDIPW